MTRTPILLLVLLLSLGFALGADYETGLAAYRQGDLDTALAQWQIIAKAGDAAAQYNLGYMYSVGEGVDINFKKASKWYGKSATQGDARAQYNLGIMYSQGHGMPINQSKAAGWFIKAAEQGDMQAQVIMGYMCEDGLAELAVAEES